MKINRINEDKKDVDEFGLPTVKALIKASVNKGGTNTKEFDSMFKLLLDERWKKVKEKYDVAKANADKFYNNFEAVSHNFAATLSPIGKSNYPIKDDYSFSYLFEDYATLFSFHGNTIEVRLYMDEEPGSEEPSIVRTFNDYGEFINWLKTDSNCNWMFGQKDKLFESLNESPDEFGIPTEDEIYNSFKKKVGSATDKDFQNNFEDNYQTYLDMQELRKQTRYKKLSEKGAAYIEREKLKDYINKNRLHFEYCLINKDLTNFDLVYNDAYPSSRNSAITCEIEDNGNVKGSLRDNDNKEHKFEMSWPEFVKFFSEYSQKNGLYGSLEESMLNESPDEYGIPTHDEIYNAYNKKIKGLDIRSKEYDDAEDEFNKMASLRIQTRFNKVKKEQGLLNACVDLLLDCRLDPDDKKDKKKCRISETPTNVQVLIKYTDFWEDLYTFDKEDYSVDVEEHEDDNVKHRHYKTLSSFFKYIWPYVGDVKVPKLNESLNEEAVSNGVYSLYKGWIKAPNKETIPDVDQKEVDKLVKPYIDRVDDCKTVEDIDELIDDIYILRQESILNDGEYGVGNLAFKEFRNKGYLGKLKEKKVELENKEMSLGGK